MTVMTIFTSVCGLLFRFSGVGGFYWGGNVMTLAKVLQGGIISRKGEEWKVGAIHYLVLYQLISFVMVFNWAQAKKGECNFFFFSGYCCVLASSSCSQCKLTKGEMDQVALVGGNTCWERSPANFLSEKGTVHYWSLLHDITHQSKWQ